MFANVQLTFCELFIVILWQFDGHKCEDYHITNIKKYINQSERQNCRQKNVQMPDSAIYGICKYWKNILLKLLPILYSHCLSHRRYFPANIKLTSSFISDNWRANMFFNAFWQTSIFDNVINMIMMPIMHQEFQGERISLYQQMVK